jgi:hypothetical protein
LFDWCGLFLLKQKQSYALPACFCLSKNSHNTCLSKNKLKQNQSYAEHACVVLVLLKQNQAKTQQPEAWGKILV